MRVHVQPGAGHGGYEVVLSGEVGREALDHDVRLHAPQSGDGLRDVARALVRQIIPVYGSEHNIVETPLGDGFSSLEKGGRCKVVEGRGVGGDQGDVRKEQWQSCLG